MNAVRVDPAAQVGLRRAADPLHRRHHRQQGRLRTLRVRIDLGGHPPQRLHRAPGRRRGGPGGRQIG